MNFLKNRSAIPRTHWLHGIKTAMAAGLCYGITTFYHLEYGYWAVISTVIVMQVYVADSIRMCLYRLSGTIIGALMGIGALLYFPDTPLGRLFAVLLPVGICSFMTHYNPRYRMAAITAVIVIMTGLQHRTRRCSALTGSSRSPSASAAPLWSRSWSFLSGWWMY